jgi:hypothetical protein
MPGTMVVGRALALRDGLRPPGLSNDHADFALLLLGFLKAGYNGCIKNEGRKLIGRDPIPFERYAEDHR